MREWCVLALPLGAKLFELVPADRVRRRRFDPAVQKWRSGKIPNNPASPSVTTTLALAQK
jgi:hypothetical protein